MHFSDHHRRTLLQSIKVHGSRSDKDYYLLQHSAELDHFNIVSIWWRVDCTLDFDVCFWLGSEQFDAIVLELRVKSIRPILLLSLHIDIALTRANDIHLTLVHEIDNIYNFADLNLISFKACDLHVIKHRDALDIEWNLQDVLTSELLQAPNANCLVQARRYELIHAIRVPCHSPYRSVHGLEFSDDLRGVVPLIDN